jgi:hypothetical protein
MHPSGNLEVTGKYPRGHEAGPVNDGGRVHLPL